MYCFLQTCETTNIVKHKRNHLHSNSLVLKVLAVDLSLDIPFVVTQLRFPGLEFQWILNTADGNAIDIYIFKLDILRVRDTFIIGHGSDPQDVASVIVNSRDGPVSHVYRMFDDYAWIQLYVTPYPQIPLQLGVRGLAEGALVDREGMYDYILYLFIYLFYFRAR